jgi:hypothetical protein
MPCENYTEWLFCQSRQGLPKMQVLTKKEAPVNTAAEPKLTAYKKDKGIARHLNDKFFSRQLRETFS